MYVELGVFSRDYKLLFWFPTKLVRDDRTGRKGDDASAADGGGGRLGSRGAPLAEPAAADQ